MASPRGSAKGTPANVTGLSWVPRGHQVVMSQRARVLWVIGLAILPLVALSGFTIWQQYLRDEFVVSTERTYFAQATAYAAEAFLDGHVAAARAVARHPLVLRGRASEELSNYRRKVATDEPDWQG